MYCKVSARDPFCGLCSESRNSFHVVRIVSKAGIKDELCWKVEISRGACITETNTKSKVMYRHCKPIAFVNRIHDFIFKVSEQQIIDEEGTDCFVKRCVEISPSCQPSN